MISGSSRDDASYFGILAAGAVVIILAAALLVIGRVDLTNPDTQDDAITAALICGILIGVRLIWRVQP